MYANTVIDSILISGKKRNGCPVTSAWNLVMTTGIYKTAVLPNSMLIFPFEISTVFLCIKCTWNSFTTENLTVGKSTQLKKRIEKYNFNKHLFPGTCVCTVNIPRWYQSNSSFELKNANSVYLS